jgi:hypothetical protein
MRSPSEGCTPAEPLVLITGQMLAVNGGTTAIERHIQTNLNPLDEILP